MREQRAASHTTQRRAVRRREGGTGNNGAWDKGCAQKCGRGRKRGGRANRKMGNRDGPSTRGFLTVYAHRRERVALSDVAGVDEKGREGGPGPEGVGRQRVGAVHHEPADPADTHEGGGGGEHRKKEKNGSSSRAHTAQLLHRASTERKREEVVRARGNTQVHASAEGGLVRLCGRRSKKEREAGNKRKVESSTRRSSQGICTRTHAHTHAQAQAQTRGHTRELRQLEG